MLIYFDNICEENNLRYYAIGGTLLGAVRHNGFIPWDNDIDVAMPRPDYDKVAKIISSDSSKYLVETPQSSAPDFLYTMSKLYDTSTTVIEATRIECKRGVYIDIFPLDGIGDSLAEVKNNYKKLNFLNNYLATKISVPRSQRKWWKNLAIRISNLVPESILSSKNLVMKLDNMCKEHDFCSSKYVGVLLTQYGIKYIMPKSLFEQRKRYVFENTTVFGVADYDQYLSLLFGDWKKLPPIEKRVEGHDYKYIDLSKSYLE